MGPRFFLQLRGGDAGDIIINADQIEMLGHTFISSSANGDALGDAGLVHLIINQLIIDGAGIPQPVKNNMIGGISSNVGTGGGQAGEVRIDARTAVELYDNAGISTTSSSGDAGSILIHSPVLLIDGRGRRTGIFSRALAEATGQVGNITIAANRIRLRGGAEITIESEQTLERSTATIRPPGRLMLSAETLTMDQAAILADSSGPVLAAPIHIQAGKTILTNSSRISTQSLQANAGAISLDGGILWVQNSQITTSAEGLAGDGGNIYLSPTYLVLDGGFIQANTDAEGASGGQIVIDIQALIIPATSQLDIGVLERETFIPGSGRNVIQAAAPQGNPGDIPNVPIRLDLASALAPTQTYEMIPLAMAEDYCRLLGTPWASTLVPLGRGGLPEEPGKPLLLFLTPEQLNELLHCE